MITKEEVKELAHLAKISILSDELEVFKNEINEMLTVVDKIKEVDLSDYDCSDEIYSVSLRDDIVEPSLPVDAVLSNAFARDGDYFVV